MAVGQQLLELLGRDLEVLGKLPANPRLRPAADAAALPAPHRGGMDSQALGQRLLGEAERSPPGGEATPFDYHFHLSTTCRPGWHERHAVRPFVARQVPGPRSVPG